MVLLENPVGSNTITTPTQLLQEVEGLFGQGVKRLFKDKEGQIEVREVSAATSGQVRSSTHSRFYRILHKILQQKRKKFLNSGGTCPSYMISYSFSLSFLFSCKLMIKLTPSLLLGRTPVSYLSLPHSQAQRPSSKRLASPELNLVKIS